MTHKAGFPLPQISRRGLFGAAASAGAYAVLGSKAAAMQSVPATFPARPIVSFHADAPYIDMSGTAEPFNARISTSWAAGLDHEALLRLGHYV